MFQRLGLFLLAAVPVTSWAGGEARRPAHPDEVRIARALYEKYRADAAAGGTTLKLSLSRFETIAPEEYGAVRWIDAVTMPGGAVIDRAIDPPLAAEHRWSTTPPRRRQRILWAARTPWLETKIGRERSETTLQQAFDEALDREPALGAIAAVTRFSVQVTLGGRTRAYDAALLWRQLPEATSAAVGDDFIVLDNVLAGLADMARVEGVSPSAAADHVPCPVLPVRPAADASQWTCLVEDLGFCAWLPAATRANKASDAICHCDPDPCHGHCPCPEPPTPTPTPTPTITPAPPQAPAYPSDLHVEPVNGDHSELWWRDNSDNEREFEIQKMPEGGGWITVGKVTTNVNRFSSPRSSNVDCFRVRAVGFDGLKSDWSEAACAVFTPQDRPPIGWLDWVTNDAAYGWSCDPDTPAATIAVHLYFDGPAGSPQAIGYPITANQASEPAVNSFCGGGSAHRFWFPLPADLKQRIGHRTIQVYAYGINTNPYGVNSHLDGSPKTVTIQP